MGYMDRNQSQKKKENIKKVLEYFDTHGGNIKEISEALDIPKSSVQRYLTDEYVAEVTSLEDLKNIKKYLADMKNEGNTRGGVTSTKDSKYIKDEEGKFRGSIK